MLAEKAERVREEQLGSMRGGIYRHEDIGLALLEFVDAGDRGW
ncbi:hypothetical protein [Mycobacterium sp.]